MINVSRIAFSPPVLEVVVMAREVKVNILGTHDWQNLLPHGLVTTVATPRVAGKVPKDNLPFVVSCCVKLVVQQFLHGLSFVLVFVNGDCVH